MTEQKKSTRADNTSAKLVVIIKRNFSADEVESVAQSQKPRCPKRAKLFDCTIDDLLSTE